MQDAGRSYKGTLDCMKSMLKNEGITSFFRGSWLRIIRIAPGNTHLIRVADSLCILIQLFYKKKNRWSHTICLL